MILLIAARNLAQHKRRTALLGGALAGVTSLLVLLLSATAGLEATLVDAATSLWTGHVNIEGFYKLSPGESFPAVTQTERLTQLAKETIPGLEQISRRGRGYVRVVSPSKSMDLALGGVDVAQDAKFRAGLKLLRGDLDALGRPGGIVIFQSQADKLKVDVGDSLLLSAMTLRGAYNTADVTVVGVAQNAGLLGDGVAYVANETLNALYQLKAETTGNLVIYLSDEALSDSTELAAKLRTAIAAGGFQVMENDPQPFYEKMENVKREEWTGQKIDVTTWEGAVSPFTWAISVLRTLSVVLVSVLLLVVVLGVMNALWIAIGERTREIGTMRAVGLQRFGVLRLFMTEALLLGLLGTSAGTLVALVIGAAVNAAGVPVSPELQTFLMRETLLLKFEPPTLVVTIAALTAVISLFSMLPSTRAARLAPITAMQRGG